MRLSGAADSFKVPGTTVYLKAAKVVEKPKVVPLVKSFNKDGTYIKSVS